MMGITFMIKLYYMYNLLINIEFQNSRKLVKNLFKKY